MVRNVRIEQENLTTNTGTGVSMQSVDNTQNVDNAGNVENTNTNNVPVTENQTTVQ